MKTFLSTLISFVLLLVLGACDVSVTKITPGSASDPNTTAAISTPNGTWIVEYFVDGKTLSYAVMTAPVGGVAHGHVSSGGDSTGHIFADLCKPDGTKIPILGTGRVFCVSGTNVTESPRRISPEALEAFLKSHPRDCSLESLLAFVGKQK